MLSVSSLCPSSCLSYSTSLQSLLYLLVTPLISSLSTRVPSHTDTMLPVLCSLFTALSCVSGVTVVTQKPPVLTLTAGQTANMDCNLGTVTNSAAYWYKQVPGGVPQHVIRHHQTWSSPKYGSGFSSPKFTSTCSSKSDCKQKEQKPQLQIIGTEVETHLMFTEDTLNSSHVKITDTVRLFIPFIPHSYCYCVRHNITTTVKHKYSDPSVLVLIQFKMEQMHILTISLHIITQNHKF
ncbi:uncharacterized protein LOC132841337 isoform X2 [Tachysurus vachellii]|uniref:uncharacterized protein LOC132841337 isoform X2 n=1 Tax=Tachysurus vachellii TaxID=175792 RepID=UPI00296B0DBE|nr:uncharacterized protein LOC132841337 isoform X2 [Tachysurus vachellii]